MQGSADNFPNLKLVQHPILVHKLTQLRDEATQSDRFRALTADLAEGLMYQASQDFVLTARSITTPMQPMQAPVLNPVDEKAMIVPILRAGMGMVDGIVRLLPQVVIGLVGMRRDEESLCPENYYYNIPQPMPQQKCFICDPMLATGGTVTAVCTRLKANGFDDLTLLSLLAAPEGVALMAQQHPDVTVYAVALDERLNEKGYILPGLGDAGDRLFQT